MDVKPPLELYLLSRYSISKLIAARSGHGDFAAYHIRFKHEDASIHCACGEHKSPEHPFYCQLTRRDRERRIRTRHHNIEDKIKWTLGTVEGAKTFHEWCSTAKPYG